LGYVGTGRHRLLEDGAARRFREDRCEGLLADASIVGAKLLELRLRRHDQNRAADLAAVVPTLEPRPPTP
jgi:hypothetical protein